MHTESEDEIHIISMREADKDEQRLFSQNLYELDDYPKVTQADLGGATFGVNLKPTPRKRRVTILLDTELVEYFRAQAGERGYQTLINKSLR